MRRYVPILVLLFGFAPLALLGQAGGCGDPRAQICSPGQYVDLLNNGQTSCVACRGNTVADGCTRSCTACGSGTVPDATHSSCIVPPVKGGCGDPRAQICSPGQYANLLNNGQMSCVACTGNTVADGCTRSCSACGKDSHSNSEHSACVPYPAGTYKDNSNPVPFGGGCVPTSMEGTTLHATCPNYFGVKDDTSLADADKCVSDKHDIENIDGHLRCVLSSIRSPNGHGDVFDIVSKVDSEDSSDNITTWRIDHPNVSKAKTTFSEITFDQGDDVRVNAGGCVHTDGGVDGQRWKKYVNPAVTMAERNGLNPQNLYSAVYAGGLYIDDTKKTLPPFTNEPLQIVMWEQPSQGFSIPGSGSSTYPKTFEPALLYYANIFSDLGYFSHDDGTDGQCRNEGPAWAEITVRHPKKPVAYSPYAKGKNFDVTWRTDIKGVDDNGLPLNPLWSYQVENPGKVPDFPSSCAPGNNFSINSPACTSQHATLDVSTSSLVGDWTPFGEYCTGMINGHLNWQIVTYGGGLFDRTWSGYAPNDDDMNYGIETDNQSGQTAAFEGPDDGIGLEFRESDTTAHYNSAFWKAIDQNAISQGGFISVNGNNPKEFADGEQGIVTGLLGIDGVHGGYSELHPVFAMAVEVAWSSGSDGSQDQTWAFFIRNSGDEGSCSENEHVWPSGIGDWTYAIQLPWPEGASGVSVVNDQYSMIETSGPNQQYLGMEGTKPWTYLRFKLKDYTSTGMDGEITLHYAGAIDKKSEKAIHRPEIKKDKKDTEESETEFGVNWNKLSSRISDPATRQQFLADVKEALGTVDATHSAKMTTVPLDQKQASFSHKQDFGAWIGKPTADTVQTNPDKVNKAAALQAVMKKYSAALKLSEAEEKK